jgi:hypothetical protein
LKSLKGLKGLRFEELLSPACRIYLPQVEASSLLLVVILIRSEGYSYLPKGVIGLRRYWHFPVTSGQAVRYWVRCTLLGLRR